jgi:hypothetical protein
MHSESPAAPAAPSTARLDIAVTPPPANGHVRLENLVRLALEAFDRAAGGHFSSDPLLAMVRAAFVGQVRERMAQAAAAWELEASSVTLDAVDQALNRAAKAEAENAMLREVLLDKQAFLEASTAKHIHEMGQQRDTVDALAAEVLWRGGKR